MLHTDEYLIIKKLHIVPSGKFRMDHSNLVKYSLQRIEHLLIMIYLKRSLSKCCSRLLFSCCSFSTSPCPNHAQSFHWFVVGCSTNQQRCCPFHEWDEPCLWFPTSMTTYVVVFLSKHHLVIQKHHKVSNGHQLESTLVLPPLGENAFQHGKHHLILGWMCFRIYLLS